jgi:7-carboxy-7-deazaguanine synthase
MDRLKPLPIIEVYPCLQSEGSLAGIPHICIRTTGCPLRCQFSDTDFCDSWYTSWHPEKGKWSLTEIGELLANYHHIRHVFITGGSPTMHPELLRILTNDLHGMEYHITLETEGSTFVSDCHIDLLSLSPKMSNSLPKPGTLSPLGKKVTDRQRQKHDRMRQNYDAMEKWIDASEDYQFKPVMSSVEDWDEILSLIERLSIPFHKVWVMPAGGTEDELQQRRQQIMEFAWQNGVNYTDRMHITAYGTKRAV